MESVVSGRKGGVGECQWWAQGIEDIFGMRVHGPREGSGGWKPDERTLDRQFREQSSQTN